MVFLLFVVFIYYIHQSPTNSESNMKKKVFIYTGEKCIFCEAAIKIVLNAIRAFPSEVRPALYIIDADKSRDDIYSVPLIKIGDLEFSGLPSFDDVKSALYQFILSNNNEICSLAC